MKKHFYLLKTCLCALAVGVLAGCSAEGDDLQLADGMGAVKLSITADTGFDTMTKAITEADYTNLANYTVQILDGNNRVVEGCEWAGNALPGEDELIELDNGNYTLLAFTGEDYKGIGATTEGMYVEGKKAFNINGASTSVSAVCTPQCARMTVAFDAKMADHFNNYYVVFTGTTALGEGNYIWEKDFTDPVYMAITGTETITATINLVDKNSKVGNPIVKTYKMTAAQAQKMNIAPVVNGGSVGISIEIDDSTNDIPVDIEIPSEWL